MLHTQLEQYSIILGSRSPRRQELLRGMGIDFSVVVSDADESFPDSMSKEEIPVFLAEKKAESISLPNETTLVITADTIVWLHNKVLNKPADAAEAVDMLSALSGHTHEVLTGVCLKTKQKKRSFYASSRVTFAPLTKNEIAYYVEKYKPFDKAGAYGVQEWIGYVGVNHIEGSFYNVMGLPTTMLYGELKKFV